MGRLVHIEMPTAQYLSVRKRYDKLMMTRHPQVYLSRSRHLPISKGCQHDANQGGLGRSLQLDIQRIRPSPPVTCAEAGLPFCTGQ